MSEELKFAALHADDLLLDALGARRSAGSSDDAVVGLLQAFVHELDTRPGPLTGLLADSTAGYAAYADFDAYAADDAAAYRPMPLPASAMVPAPPIDEPVDLPTHRRAIRAKSLMAHRAAAVVTVGALVLGIGGVSAAVTGDGGPLDGIRRVVTSVTEQVTPQSSDAERISRMLTDAEKALAADDLRVARELLEKARTGIEGASDPTTFTALRGNLIQLRDRWHQAFDEGAESAPGAKPDKDKLDSVPSEGVLTPDGKPDLVEGSPAEGTLMGPESGIKQTKDQIADRAEQKLEPLPALPVGELRAPTWAPIIGGDK